jgi:hypothetical protein
MRVIVDGGESFKINEIVIKTMLNGLYIQYKDTLHIAYRGIGYVSKIAEKWSDKTFGSSSVRRSFNADWLYRGLLDENPKERDFADIFIEDYKPDLIFIFGGSSLDYKRYARYSSIPLYIVSKND